jgi:hypothetical protein
MMWRFFLYFFPPVLIVLKKGVSKLWRFILLTYLTFTSLIYFKNFLIPALLEFLLPLSDFRSTLYEVFILFCGIVASFLYFSIGSFACVYYRLSTRVMVVALFLIMLPMFLADWSEMPEWLQQWGRLWTDLIGEPYRLLTFTYTLSDLFSIGLTVLLCGTGFYLQSRTGKRFQRPRSSRALRGM